MCMVVQTSKGDHHWTTPLTLEECTTAGLNIFTTCVNICACLDDVATRFNVRIRMHLNPPIWMDSTTACHRPCHSGWCHTSAPRVRHRPCHGLCHGLTTPLRMTRIVPRIVVTLDIMASCGKVKSFAHG